MHTLDGHQEGVRVKLGNGVNTKNKCRFHSYEHGHKPSKAFATCQHRYEMQTSLTKPHQIASS